VERLFGRAVGESPMPPYLGEATMRRRLLTLVLAVAVLVPHSALSWNGRGHIMVAAVAYQKLNQATKDPVDALLLLNPDRDNWLDLIPVTASVPQRKMMIFMIAASWADRIKSDPDYQRMGLTTAIVRPTTRPQNIVAWARSMSDLSSTRLSQSQLSRS
jgi:hypothetical protein